MDDSSEAPAFDLAFHLNQSAYALGAQMTAALEGHGLTIGEYCVLWKAGEGERTQIEIAEQAALDKSAVVKAVDGLESAGLAERHGRSTDRRVRVVSLTDKGRTLLGEAHRAVQAVYDDALSDLSPTQRQQFLTSLQRVTTGALAEPSHVSALRRRAAR